MPMSTEFLQPWEQLPPDRAAVFEAEIQAEPHPNTRYTASRCLRLPAHTELTMCSLGWTMIASFMYT